VTSGIRGVKEKVVSNGSDAFCYAKLPELSKKLILKDYFRSGSGGCHTLLESLKNLL